MFVKVIRTPTDFKRTLGTDDFVLHEWVTPAPEIEPIFRGAVDEIFSDLQDISADEPGIVASYLDQIYQPLMRLQELGIQLVGMVWSGNMQFRAPALGSDEMKSLPWKRTIYVLAPHPAYYSLSEEKPIRTHIFGIDCEGSRKIAAGKGGDVKVWGSREAVERDYEARVPWCDTCFLAVAAEEETPNDLA